MAENSAPTSFIPHDTGVVSPSPRRRSAGLNDLLLLSSIVLFVASAALAGGVFLYQQFLATESASKLSQLERAQAAFQPSLIQELTRLDDRMHAADRILGSHLAPTAFFAALEQATLQTISFQSLDFQVPDSQHMTIKMAGIAQSVNSIALQADLFSKNGTIAGPIFSNIARQSDGVHFNLSAVVNPISINYAALVASVQNAGIQNQTLPTTEAPTNPSPFDAPIPETTPPQN
ncbi:hypothetical protein COU17_02000 [Candidatus Kaiserbacteria bacterium CG10_big_fil_rev_8_21_14_0_10_49_17]|uniref:PilN domain-containing protein n=1 Tax=Candidatus Kaiserbacteria bacterium CG10_big_fil_rev_8_21_14_0_10_49_17 TaxID=1974609 RepID=A0A2M6WED9_9BACT|nr:MAG: hypothetical protein COU17_02000 [Candidatus Kaiserbacteria bacterium CG10_big_fil_rev_8_21_14_0_10_49_17]